jgi:hypothetical protein
MFSNIAVWFINSWNAIAAFFTMNAELVRWNVAIVVVVLLAIAGRHMAKRRIASRTPERGYADKDIFGEGDGHSEEFNKEF